MELKKNTIRQSSIKCRAESQITLDDDCIVSDKKPDVGRIIHTEGRLVFEKARVTGSAAQANGQLKFCVLYISVEERLEALCDTVHFTEKIYMDGICDQTGVNLSGKLEDINITTINPRKLAIRAVVSLAAECEEETDCDLAIGIEGDEPVQQLTKKRRMLELSFAGSDLVRVHRDFSLPASLPNISRIIYSHMETRKCETVLRQGTPVLQGEVCVSMLYRSTEGTDEWYETSLPFKEELDAGAEGEDPVLWVRCETEGCSLLPAADNDGELRNLVLDLTLDTDIKIWRECEAEILEDAYIPGKNLEIRRTPAVSPELLVKNEAQIKVQEQMKLPEAAERILQLCTWQGSVELDRAERCGGAICVEGILCLHILYTAPDDIVPLSCVCEQIPFSQKIDVPGMPEKEETVSFRINPQIARLSVNLLDQEHYEVKAEILTAVLVLLEEEYGRIESIEEGEITEELISGRPGAVGYRVKDETLWELAKKFGTTRERIMEVNGLASSTLKPGQKLLIINFV